MADSVTFSASGDVNDIGVTLSIELDGDAASAKTNSGATYSSTTSMNVVDSHSIKFDLGDAGTLTFAGHGGSSAMSAVDDVMPNAYEEPWDVVSVQMLVLLMVIAVITCLLTATAMTRVSILL